jgi:RimJ/RimL family protein N-acetyltransferase
MTPRIETPNLILRGWEPADFAAYCAFVSGSARMTHVGSGALSQEQAWHAFCAMIGEWQLRGYGTFAVEEKSSGELCGYAGLWHPATFDEPELCWSLFDGFEGKGIAREAADAVRLWAHDTLHLPALFSLVHPDNTRSMALAERLGASVEKHDTYRGMPRLVYRHTLPATNHT